jgi:hypothetical protein
MAIENKSKSIFKNIWKELKPNFRTAELVETEG